MNTAIPEAMRAIQLDEPGGQLVLRELPVPHAGRGQVLVRMIAAPINPSDLGSLIGVSYSGARTYPFTPGIEGSGTVVETGAGLMPWFLKGRRVACSAPTGGDGTWAEYMLTSAQLCTPLAKNVSLEQGAILLVNPLTALAIFEIAKKGKHRAIVSTAAASALGGMILRLGKRHHIPIIHVVRRQEQVELVRQEGGEHVLNSNEADFPERLKELSGRLQATLLLDAIGDGMTQVLAEAAPFGSTILLYSKLSRENSNVDNFTALVKDLHFDGWFLPNWLRKKNIFQILQLSRQAQALIGDDLSAPIHKHLPLSQAQQGLEEYVQKMSAGKILLVMDTQQGGF